MDYIKPHCCVCGGLCEPVKKTEYSRKHLYFCRQRKYNDCIKSYWRDLHEKYAGKEVNSEIE